MRSGILSSGCRGRSVLLDACRRSDVGATFRGGGVLMRSGILSGGCRGRSVELLTDVQTLGTTIRGRWCSVLSSVCRGRSVELLTDVQTLGATIRGGGALMRSASCRAVAVAVLLDAYGRSDVGASIRGGGALMRPADCGGVVVWWLGAASLCSARCLQTFRRGRNLSGRWCSDALGHLVGRLPWSFC